MKIIAKKGAKQDKYDLLRCIREDGSETAMPMPRQGVLAHDLIHYVVESALGYRHGFLGMVASGADIAYAMQQSHDLQAELAVQAKYAESIVESLQAQLWSGGFDPAQFQAGLESACASRDCTAPDLGGIDAEKDLYQAVLNLTQRWQALAYHANLELEMF